MRAVTVTPIVERLIPLEICGSVFVVEEISVVGDISGRISGNVKDYNAAEYRNGHRYPLPIFAGGRSAQI